MAKGCIGKHLFQHRILIFTKDIETGWAGSIDEQNITKRNVTSIKLRYRPHSKNELYPRDYEYHPNFSHQSDTYGLLWFFSYRQIIFDQYNFPIEQSVSWFSLLSRILRMSLRSLKFTLTFVCQRDGLRAFGVYLLVEGDPKKKVALHLGSSMVCNFIARAL